MSTYQKTSLKPFQLNTFCLLVLSIFFLCLWTPLAVWAEGSKELNANGGHRAYLVYGDFSATNPDKNLAGISLESKIYVYAKAGETIHLGSSAMGTKPDTGTWSGQIIATAPDGSTTATFNNASSGGSCGTIANLSQEQAGPVSLPSGTGGYNDCVITVAADGTITAGSSTPAIGGTGNGVGIWQIKFVSPKSSSTTNEIDSSITNIPLASDSWAQKSGVRYIAAWDVTVSSGTTAIPGRVYANYLAINMGHQDAKLNAQTFVQTHDGALYSVNLNGIQPFLGVFFSNNKGFVDSGGNSIYRSLQFDLTDPLYGSMPAGYSINSPSNPDSGSNITQKLFLNKPDSSLPGDSPINGGTTWLNPEYKVPKVPPLSFKGLEGTPGQLGTRLGGNFEFTNPNDIITYSIRIDIDKDGTYGNNNDRVLIGTANTGLKTVLWDGLDGNNEPVKVGDVLYKAVLEFNVGEVHFPFIDAEHNKNGFIIERVDPADSDKPPFLIYYDDQYSTQLGTSLCAASGDVPTPVPPNCYGKPPSPRQARGGVDSTSGKHSWDSKFGDRRGVDTWAYIPYRGTEDPATIRAMEADLTISKEISSFDKTTGTLVYKVTVTNKGDSNLDSNNKASVTDTVPNQITGVTWTCTVTGTGQCDTPGGTGNNISVPIFLNKGASATLTITGQLTTAESVENTATVNRPNDVNDPIVTNNTASVSTASLNHSPPTAASDTASVPENSSVTIPVLNNDMDPDGDMNPPRTLTIASNPPNGTVTVNADGTLTYTPKADFSGTDTFTYTVCDQTGLCSTATVTVTVSELPPVPPAVVTEVDLTVSILNGGNGSVTSTPNGINCDNSGGDCEQTYDPGAATEVTLTPTPASGYQFDHWTGNSDCLDGKVTMDRNLQCIAVFVPGSGTGSTPTPNAGTTPNADPTLDGQVDLTVTTIGHGTVASEPADFDCGINATCVETYDVGKQVTLIPIPDPGWSFQGWEGDCETTAVLEMTTDKSCQAVFVPDTAVQVDLTVTIEGAGGVASIPIGIDCGDVDDCTESYPQGSHVELSATPRVGHEFVGWGGDCAGLVGNPINVELETSKNCTAIFQTATLPPVPGDNSLLIDIIGEGLVKSSDGGIQCGTDCIENYAPDSFITLTATPKEGYRFKGWTGSCSGTDSMITVTVNAAKTCVAAFELIPIDDNDGVPATLENKAPNHGDGNDDGILDSEQNNVVSLPTAEGHYVTVEVSEDCEVDTIRLSERALPPDGDYYYPYLLDYFLNCPTADITVYHHGVKDICGYTCRQYAPVISGLAETSQWQNSAMTCGTEQVAGNTVATSTFTLKDGELGDNGDTASQIFHTRGCGTQAGCLAFTNDTFMADEFGNVTTNTATVSVSRQGEACAGDVSVDYATSDNTAKQGEDYLTTTGVLTWSDGDCSDKTISIPIKDDLLPEGDETLTILLSNLSGAPFCEGDKTTLTLKDNESPASQSLNGNGCYNLPTCNVCCNSCQAVDKLGEDDFNVKTLVATIKVGDTIDLLFTEGKGILLLKEIPDSTIASLDSWKPIGTGVGQVTLTGVKVGNTKMVISDSNLSQVATIYVKVIPNDTDANFGIRALHAVIEVGQTMDITVAGGKGALSINELPDKEFVSLEAWNPLNNTGAAEFRLKGLQIGETDMIIHDSTDPPQKVTVNIRVIETKLADALGEPTTNPEGEISACENGNALAINAQGQEVATDSCFSGLIFNHTQKMPNETHFSYTEAQNLELIGAVKIDPAHVGHAADLLLVGVYQTLTAERDYLRNKETWQAWDRQLSTLQAAESYAQLPEIIELPIYKGDLSQTPGEFTVFMGYRLVDGTIVYNGLAPIHFFVGNSQRIHINTKPTEIGEGATYFEPFVYNFDGELGNNLTFANRDLFNISAFVRVEPQHVGQMADILMVAVHKRSLDQVEYTRDSQAWHRWDNQIDSLRPVEHYLQLPETLEIPVYMGSLATIPGEFVIYVGYRTQDGMITFNGLEPIHLTVANSLGLTADQQLFETTARFASWVYKDHQVGNPFQTSVTDLSAFGIGVNIIPDPRHVGEIADIQMIAVDSPAKTPVNDLWGTWDKQQIRFSTTLPALTLEPLLRSVPLFAGPVSDYGGYHTIFICYQLKDGTLVYNGGETLYFGVQK